MAFSSGLVAAAAAKSLQSCPTLRDPMDCSPPGSSIHGTFQARTLEWGAIAFSDRAGWWDNTIPPECSEDWGPWRSRRSLSLKGTHRSVGLLLVVPVGTDSSNAALRALKQGETPFLMAYFEA